MISENEICERFGVSRTPVRDALRLLQEQGFVETVPLQRYLCDSVKSGQHQTDDLHACGSGNHGAEGFSESPKSYDPGRNPSRHCYAESP